MPSPEKLGPSTSCESSFQTANSWLQSCCDNHSSCARYSTTSTKWHPTRLIDLGPEGSAYWRFRDTTRDGPVSSEEAYIALSYRWGQTPSILLLTSTIDDFFRGRPIQNLPRTFRELALVARRFSVRYIWIDALCIIQDSKEDWDVQALTMRQVYSNALCTVAASASSDEEGGLFRERTPSDILPAAIDLSINEHGSSQRFCVYERDYWDKNIFAGPLHKRGWVFQERHLSPRVLYFGESQILWECFNEAKCEGFPGGTPFYWSNKNLYALWDQQDGKKTLPAADHEFQGAMPLHIYSFWRDLVKAYSQCNLTKMSDKLPAFAGIAKVFQETTDDEYLAGLWRTRLLEGLDWRVEEPAPRSCDDYRAPSWSWASIDGPVKPMLPGAISEHLLEVVDAQVKPKGVDMMGEVTSSRLVVRGAVTSVMIDTVKDDEYSVSILSNGRYLRVKLRLCFDSQGDEFSENQAIYILPLNSRLAGYPPVHHSEVMFLVVEPVTSGQTLLFRRMGYFTSVDGEFLQCLGFSDRGDGLMVLRFKSDILTIV
ncbi:heterokaryon incompatibility protein [Colletotrichum truncatum]|uniref:Heterokaryon incompatibility protein n=1 Tax=Colletotrichum truncatum TaxID=5467 RepID=A0ACC3YU34_COLTU|nr:heterokaryon incompatibility protein [Colletotrichum truncatum]KAF6798625.1 heterokaryon incompatibility protein [Colletotrichum truncatum]